MSSVWIEKRRQKIIKGLGAGGKEVSDDEVLKELKKAVDADLRLDYLVTGSQVSLTDYTRIRWLCIVGPWRLAKKQQDYLGQNTSMLLLTQGNSTMENLAKLPKNPHGLWARNHLWYTCAKMRYVLLLGFGTLLTYHLDRWWSRISKLSKDFGSNWFWGRCFRRRRLLIHDSVQTYTCEGKNPKRYYLNLLMTI